MTKWGLVALKNKQYEWQNNVKERWTKVNSLKQSESNSQRQWHIISWQRTYFGMITVDKIVW